MFGTVDALVFAARLPLAGSAAVARGSGAGFHWADAGLGAAGALALVLAVIGAMLVIGELRRPRRDREPARGANGRRRRPYR